MWPIGWYELLNAIDIVEFFKIDNISQLL